MEEINHHQVFSIESAAGFEKFALESFRFQVQNCPVYGRFVRSLNVHPEEITSIDDIPYLPIEFFKTHDVYCGSSKPEAVFTSSGTTGSFQSRHLVKDLSIYRTSYREGFNHFYGPISDYHILSLLPSYQEREGSSLIYMIDDLIRLSGKEQSGHFLYDHGALNETLLRLKEEKKPTLLIGVTYALLDFAESRSLEYPELIVMETGGMKGRRREMVREEVHEILSEGFGVPAIHSEYGMTELLAQAYSKGAGLFHCPPWMKVNIRDTNDPFEMLGVGEAGGINIIDLTNIFSCSFLATQDLGKLHHDGTFEVLGRFDNSDIRGCNLLVEG